VHTILNWFVFETLVLGFKSSFSGSWKLHQRIIIDFSFVGYHFLVDFDLVVGARVGKAGYETTSAAVRMLDGFLSAPQQMTLLSRSSSYFSILPSRIISHSVSVSHLASLFRFQTSCKQVRYKSYHFPHTTVAFLSPSHVAGSRSNAIDYYCDRKCPSFLMPPCWWACVYIFSVLTNFKPVNGLLWSLRTLCHWRPLLCILAPSHP
jgi:hypothetical protein